MVFHNWVVTRNIRLDRKRLFAYVHSSLKHVCNLSTFVFTVNGQIFGNVCINNWIRNLFREKWSMYSNLSWEFCFLFLDRNSENWWTQYFLNYKKLLHSLQKTFYMSVFYLTFRINVLRWTNCNSKIIQTYHNVLYLSVA